MADQSTALIDDLAPSEPAKALRYVGSARFTLDRFALAERVVAEMHRAVTPASMTPARLRAYCVERSIEHPRFEAALLGEALKTVSVEDLITRLCNELRERMPRTLASPYTCTSERRDGATLLSIGGDRFGEPKYVITGDEPRWAVIPGFATATGTLSVRGSLSVDGGQPLRINTGWEVPRGTSCASFGRTAGACFAPPIRTLLGCLAGDALDRLTRALPREIASVLRESSEPGFIHLERVFRLGRLGEASRVYMLYWNRLRDYLIWSVAS